MPRGGRPEGRTWQSNQGIIADRADVACVGDDDPPPFRGGAGRMTPEHNSLATLEYGIGSQAAYARKHNLAFFLSTQPSPGSESFLK
jgi:hypothetical protein